MRSAVTTLSANSTLLARRLAERIGRLEPAPVHPGSPGLRRPRPRRSIHQRHRRTSRASRNRIGGTYPFNYDILRDRFLQQRYVAYYNAQCCGVGFEYQTFNLQGSLVRTVVPQDRRFNISFTLAGIGTFSNLFGAFGGQQSR